MKKQLVALVSAVAVFAPAGAFAMPVGGVSASSGFDGAKIERAEVVVRTGPVVRRAAPRVVVRRPPVVVRRPAPRVIVR